MKSLERELLKVLWGLGLIAIPVFGQWLNHPAPGIPRLPDGRPNLAAPAPRMPDGRPGLSGLWKIVRGGRYSLNVAADLKPDEIQPWARALARRQMEEQGDGVKCLPGGPQVGGIITLYKFVQTPGLMIILHEAGTGDAFRQVFMDGRELPKDPTPSWYGYSVGRWDDDSLVIDTSGSMTGRCWTHFVIRIRRRSISLSGSEGETSDISSFNRHMMTPGRTRGRGRSR